jgi:Uma2 family endonuclease
MNIVATRAAEGFPRRSFTVAEILQMVDAGIIAEDENFELIDGEVVVPSLKGNSHEIIKSAISLRLVEMAAEQLRIAVSTSLYLDERTFLEPDFILYPKRLLPVDANGTDILLAVEVAASSMKYDRGLKAKIYARHAVHELWVIDADTRVTWVHRRPQADGQWGHIEAIAADQHLSPELIPTVSVRMADLD